MAKKKPKGDGVPKPNRSPSYSLYARISPELGEALNRYVDSLRPRPSLASVLEVFIEDSLAKAGFWPEQKGGE
jgi:hypothetical protein